MSSPKTYSDKDMPDFFDGLLNAMSKKDYDCNICPQIYSISCNKQKCLFAEMKEKNSHKK